MRMRTAMLYIAMYGKELSARAGEGGWPSLGALFFAYVSTIDSEIRRGRGIRLDRV